MKLYEIKDEIEHYLDNAFDAETGEIIDESALNEFDNFEGAKTEKLLNIGCFIYSLNLFFLNGLTYQEHDLTS